MDLLSEWGMPLLVVLVAGGAAYGIAQITMRWLDGQEELAKDQEEQA